MPQPAHLNQAPWSRRAIVVMAVVGGTSLLLSFVLLMYRGDPGSGSVSADGYSRSAIGHTGVVQLLKQLGRPVLQNRQQQPSVFEVKRRSGVMVVAEPEPASLADKARVVDLLQSLPHGLLVLPKRRGDAADEDPEKRSWLGRSEVLELKVPQQLIDILTEDGDHVDVVRAELTGRWRSTMGLPEPTIAGEVQLLAAANVEALIDCRGGVLLGKIGGTWVLSDPDVLANHGLAVGDNAAFMVALLDQLRGDGPIVFDETLHGRIYDPSVWEVLGRFPMVLLPVHLLLLLAMVLWVAAGRFGAPLPPPRAIAPGKGFLIDNIAALLGSAGHDDQGLEQYFRVRLRAAAKWLHVPPGLDDAACQQWLAARSGKDGAVELSALAAQVAARPRADKALATARAIQHWTEEKKHGTR